MAIGSFGCVGAAAFALLSANEPSAPIEPLEKGFGTRRFEGFPTARQTGVGHEIGMRIERLFIFRLLYANARTIGQNQITLLVIEQIGNHDLIEDLLMHGRIEDR